MQRHNTSASARSAWLAFKRERDVNGLVAGCAFLSSMAALYLGTSMRSVIASVPVEPAWFAMPFLLLAATGLAAGVLGCINIAGKATLVGGARRGTLLACFITIAACSFAQLVSVLAGTSLLDVQVLLALGSLVASTTCMIAATGPAPSTLSGVAETSPDEGPAPFKVVLGRAAKACASQYWKLLAGFVIVQVIMKVVRLLVIVPWGTALLQEELFLVGYLRDNNYIAGTIVDPAIMDRARALVIWQNVHFIVNDAFQSTFYFTMLGLATCLVVKSHRGSDTGLAHPFSRDWRVLARLVGLSFLFSLVYHALLMILVVPGILFYAYCIMAFPNLLVGRKFRFFENFGRAKDLLKDNALRTIGFVLLLFVVRIAANYPASSIMAAVQAAAGGPVTTHAWLLVPFEHLGDLVALEAMEGMIGAFIGPLEAAIVAMLYVDLVARQRAAKAKPRPASPENRVEALKNLPLADRIKKARYCPTCGLSVRTGLVRCPNCKAAVAP